MALQVSKGSGTSSHSHTAAQIIVALSGQLQVKMSPKESYSTCDAVLIPPNVNHHIISIFHKKPDTINLFWLRHELWASTTIQVILS
jgi:quercetin dioxygenase-like cupin family protein